MYHTSSTTPISQNGQSLAEFAISVSVLIVFLLGIPMVAKIANVNIMSIQALDYAAWRVREGNTNNTKLTTEVSDRYFGETALIVDSQKVLHSGANLGTGKNGNQIYQYDSVSVQYTATPHIPNDFKLEKGYKLPITQKSGVVSINVPLQNLNVISQIPESLTINKSLYIEAQTLTAQDNTEIKQKIGDISNTIVPYNSGAQKTSNKLVNAFIGVLKGVTLGFINEHKIASIDIEESTLPKDRLEVYKP